MANTSTRVSEGVTRYTQSEIAAYEWHDDGVPREWRPGRRVSLAAAGFVALAPDLYRDEQATTPDNAQRLLMALDMSQTASVLRDGAECRRGFDAVVDFYGIFNPHVPVLIADVAATGVRAETYFYDAGHAFFNDTCAVVYDPDAASLAWTRALEFPQQSPA